MNTNAVRIKRLVLAVVSIVLGLVGIVIAGSTFFPQIMNLNLNERRKTEAMVLFFVLCGCALMDSATSAQYKDQTSIGADDSFSSYVLFVSAQMASVGVVMAGSAIIPPIVDQYDQYFFVLIGIVFLSFGLRGVVMAGSISRRAIQKMKNAQSQALPEPTDVSVKNN